MPRTTSSWSLVSSRATQARRGPRTRAADSRDSGEPVRRLEPDQRLAPLAQGLERALALALASRQEAEKRVGHGGQPGQRQRGRRRRGARHHEHSVSRARRRPRRGARRGPRAWACPRRRRAPPSRRGRGARAAPPTRDSSRGPGQEIRRADSPKRAASLAVTRVSSQKIASASARACRPRGERSSRLPMGVPTTRRRPLLLDEVTGNGKIARGRWVSCSSNASGIGVSQSRAPGPPVGGVRGGGRRSHRGDRQRHGHPRERGAPRDGRLRRSSRTPASRRRRSGRGSSTVSSRSTSSTRTRPGSGRRLRTPRKSRRP